MHCPFGGARNCYLTWWSFLDKRLVSNKFDPLFFQLLRTTVLHYIDVANPMWRINGFDIHVPRVPCNTMMHDSLNDTAIGKRNLSHRNMMRLINKLKNKNGDVCWMKLTRQLPIINSIEMYPVSTMPISLAVKLAKILQKWNLAVNCTHRINQTEKNNRMSMLKKILFWNATIRNKGTNEINRLKQPKGNTSTTFWSNINQTSKTSWQIIKFVTYKRKYKMSCTKFKSNGTIIDNEIDIADKFNHCVANVGIALAKSTPTSHKHPNDYMSSYNDSNSFLWNW